MYNASHDMHPGYWDSHNGSIVFNVFFVLSAVYCIVLFVILFITMCSAVNKDKTIPDRYRHLTLIVLLMIVYFAFYLVTGFYHYMPIYPGRNIQFFIICNLYVWLL